jgi:hypothetical protein
LEKKKNFTCTVKNMQGNHLMNEQTEDKNYGLFPVVKLDTGPFFERKYVI